MTSPSAAPLVDARIRRLIIPGLVVLGYVAFVLTGYNPFNWPPLTDNGVLALPLYAYFSLLFLTFDVVIAQRGRWDLVIYAVASSAVTLSSVGYANFIGGTTGLLHNPTTYVVLNGAGALIFLYGLRMQPPAQLKDLQRDGSRISATAAPEGYVRFAAAFLGLWMLGFLFWGLLAFVQMQLGVKVVLAGVALGELDRNIGLGGLFLGLVFMVIVGLFASGNGFVATLQRILGAALQESGYSLRFVLSRLCFKTPLARQVPGVGGHVSRSGGGDQSALWG